jgi:hypothetical protein
MAGRTRLPGLTSAHISSCDGQSTFFILADRSNLDGTHTLALLCISAQHGVRDGHIATRQTNAQAEYLLSRFMAEAGVEFVRVRIDQANALVQRTLREHPDIPEDVKPVLQDLGCRRCRHGQLAPSASIATAAKRCVVHAGCSCLGAARRAVRSLGRDGFTHGDLASAAR